MRPFLQRMAHYANHRSVKRLSVFGFLTLFMAGFAGYCPGIYKHGVATPPSGAPVEAVSLALASAQAQEIGQNAPDARVQSLPKLSFAPLVKAARPAVVNVFASKTLVKSHNPLFDDPVFRQFFGDRFEDNEPSQTQSLGSGVIVSRTGLIVTNQHVIEGMDAVRVVLSDRREFDAAIVLRDPRSDLAMLKLKTAESDFPVLQLGDSDQLEVGDFVLAIGNPFGVGQSVTQGIVSALARSQINLNDYNYFIQTDAAINPGNSGGALVDLSGRLVGINSAIYSRSGGSQGIGFAIPAVMLRPLIAAAESGQKSVRRPYFGARLQTLTRDLADTLGLAQVQGALVNQVTAGTPADKAGLQKGDVITALDKAPVEDAEAFGFRLATHVIGGEASLTVMRKGAPLSLSLPFLAAPELPARDVQRISGQNPLSGVSIENYSPAVAEETGLQLQGKLENQAVIVMGVAQQTPAEEIGLQKNDILLAINDVRIASVRDVLRLIASHPSYWKITVQRGNQQLTTMVGG